MKKKYKLFMAFLILISSFMLNSEVLHGASRISIIVNNKNLEGAFLLEKNVVFAPISVIAKAFDATVISIAKTKTVNIKNDSIIIALQDSNTKISVLRRNDATKKKEIKMNVAPKLVKNVMYAPMKNIAEAFGAIAGWDAKTSTMIIVYDTSLKYNGKISVSKFAGTGEREKHDSTIDKMSFVSPESIDISKDGSIYVSDSGVIRKIKGKTSETVQFEPDYITSDIIRCYGNDLYILTNEFQEEDGIKYYGIVKLTEGKADGIFITESDYSKITDFAFSEEGKMYVLQNNIAVGKNYLAILDTDTKDINTLTEVDNGVTCLAIGKKGNVFLGNSAKGSIYYYDLAKKQLRLFAGVDNKTKFVDGPNSMFFEPRKLRYANDNLYVLDYNILRKISMNKNDIAISSETLAGNITVEANPETSDGKGSEVLLAPSYLMDFVVYGKEVLLTDPKKSILRVIK